ncbi:MAG: CD225/dispanin family protein [Actinobacteria bacterium]|nr:CD225/dispanin family protein [Actinomycetota bacterium]MBO0834948.1 CD225/dispanin family protein [Actinomycetota bacterium]
MSYDPPTGQYGPPAPPPQPGYGGYAAPGTQMPPAYRGWAVTCIVLGVFFSLILGMPFGIVANVYAGKVQRSWQMGDWQGALSASKQARTWAIISTIFIVLGFFVDVYFFTHFNSSTT